MGVITQVSDNEIIVSNDGAKGPTGDPGTDGLSVDAVRLSLLDNPLTHIFKKNKLVDTLSGELTWTRDSVASYVDRYGVVRYAGGNQATNLLTYSEDFGDAAWSKASGGSITSNVAIAPDGTLTADLLTAANVTGYLSQVVNSNAGDTITLSCFFKYTDWDICYFRFDGNSNIFNIRTALPITVSPGYTMDITRMNDGWIKVSLTRTIASTGDIGLQIGITSNVAGETCLVWGAQLEQSRAANGYLKTEATAITTPTFSSFGVDVGREEKEGWLIEGASTNLALWSEDFNNPAWGKSNITLSDDSSGYANLQNWKLITSTDNVGAETLFQVINMPVGESTISCHVKQGTSDSALLLLNEAGANACAFDFASKTFSGISAVNARFKELADGVFRLSLKVTSAGGDFAVWIGIPAGETVGSTLLATGYQVDSGLPNPTSYIPTESASVTRAADIVDCTPSQNLPKLDEDKSAFYKVKTLGFKGGFQFIYSVDGVGSTDGLSQAVAYRGDNPNRLNFYVGGASSQSVTFTDGSEQLVVGEVYEKIGVNTIYDNGSVAGSDSRLYVDSPTPVSFVFGRRIGFNGQEFFGHLQDFRIYDFALNADEIAFLAGEE